MTDLTHWVGTVGAWRQLDVSRVTAILLPF